MKSVLRHMALLALIGAFCCSVSGCAYLHTQRPLSVEFHKTELGTKEGKASSRSVLWLVAWGDSGIKAAADDGKLKVIECADTEVFSVLFGLYTRITTVVYGN